jgi:hypothetical protein
VSWDEDLMSETPKINDKVRWTGTEELFDTPVRIAAIRKSHLDGGTLYDLADVRNGKILLFSARPAEIRWDTE